STPGTEPPCRAAARCQSGGRPARRPTANIPSAWPTSSESSTATRFCHDLPMSRPAEERHRHHPDPFIGRRDEVLAVARAWNSVRKGGSEVVQIRGEPGIGKTTLAGAFLGSLDADAFVLAGG